MRCVWVICESSTRWQRSVYSWGQQALPSGDDQISIISTADCDAALTYLQREPTAAAIWELPSSDASQTFAAIAEVASEGHLQFAALDPGSSLGHRSAEVQLALQGLGVSTLLTQTCDLYPWLPLVSRYWQASRTDNNLSAVQQVWDRLPWK